jgi:HK97 family phage major capsid protein
MAVSTTTAASLIPTQVAKVLVKPLEAASKFLAAGPVIYDTAAPLKLPKLGPPVTDPGLTAENGLIPERDVTVSDVSLLPSTMDSVKVITRFSNELIRQSVLSLDSVLQLRLVTDVAAKLDSIFWSASGDGVDTPRGLWAYSGIQNVNSVGVITLDHLLQAEELAVAGNVNTENLKWVFNSATFFKLRRIKTATSGSNEYVLNPDPTKRGAWTIFGYPVIWTDRIPEIAGPPNTYRGALVDFSQLAVARDLAPSVTFLRERYAEYDQAAIRVVARYDAAPLNAAAVVSLNGITK